MNTHAFRVVPSVFDVEGPDLDVPLEDFCRGG